MGTQNQMAETSYKHNFIAIGFGAQKDLTHNLPDTWQEFRNEHRDDITSTGWFAFWILHRFITNMSRGDIVIMPLNQEECCVGEIISDAYWSIDKESRELRQYFQVEGWQAHARNIKWYPKKIQVKDMSRTLVSSIRKRGTMHSLNKYADEIEQLLFLKRSLERTIDNTYSFAKEEHLQEFLIANWNNTDIGKQYDIYREGDEVDGQEFETETGRIDILTISKDGKELLVIELKRRHATDAVVGQVLRYMGDMKHHPVGQGKTIRGMVIAAEDDIRIRRALEATQGIDFRIYSMSFSFQAK